MDRKPYDQRFSAIKQEAQSWLPALKDISRYIRPTRGFFDDSPNNGRAIDSKLVLDAHASRSARILAAGMTSGLTSPSRPWFKLGLADTDLMAYDPVKIWLDTAQQRMMAAFSKSNMYGTFHSMYEEIGPFGTAAASILEDYQDMIRGRAFTCGEYYLGQDANCRMNTFGRKFFMTVGQLVQEFGLKNCSPSVQNLYDKNSIDTWVPVIHLIVPNKDRKPGKLDSINMPFQSIHWEEGSPQDSFLRIKGFEDFPIIAPRWDVTTSADVYGRSPGWDSIGDVKMLQKMQKDKLIALDKIVDPPMQKDASVNGDVNTLPGGVSISSSTSPNAGVRPAYQINPDLNALEQSIRLTRNDISENFYTNLFMMMAQSDRKNITAREVIEKHEEKLLMLGPVIERLESEMLDPTIDRVFNILLRNGVIPRPPKELEGMIIQPTYISVLAQAQKMVGTTAVEQHFGFVSQLASANPEVLDTIDFDETAIEYGEMLGVPPKMIRSKEMVAARRKQRADAQQAAELAARGQSMIDNAATMSKTQLGQNSALDAVLGGITGNQTGGGIPL